MFSKNITNGIVALVSLVLCLATSSSGNPIPAYHGSTFVNNFPLTGLHTLYTFDQFDCNPHPSPVISQYRNYGSSTAGPLTGSVPNECRVKDGADRGRPGIIASQEPTTGNLDSAFKNLIGNNSSGVVSFSITTRLTKHSGVLTLFKFTGFGSSSVTFMELIFVGNAPNFVVQNSDGSVSETLSFSGTAIETAMSSASGEIILVAAIVLNESSSSITMTLRGGATASATVSSAKDLREVFQDFAAASNPKLRVATGAAGGQNTEFFHFSIHSGLLGASAADALVNAGKIQTLPVLHYGGDTNSPVSVRTTDNEDNTVTINLETADVVRNVANAEFEFEIQTNSPSAQGTASLTGPRQIQFVPGENVNTGNSCTPITVALLVKHVQCAVDDCKTFNNGGAGQNNILTLEFCLNPVNDPPTNIQPSVVQVQYPIQQLFDLTWVDIDSTSFTVTPVGTPQGTLGKDDCNSLESSPFTAAAVNGAKTQKFCFKPDVRDVDTSSQVIAQEVITFNVHDGVESVPRVVTFQLLNPLEVCPGKGANTTCTFSGLEDSSIPIVLQGRDNTGTERGPYQLKIEDLPLTGTMSLTAGGVSLDPSVPIDADEVTADPVSGWVASATVYYQPPKDYFNRGNVEGTVTHNPTGEYLGDLVKFSFTLLNNGVNTYTESSEIIVANSKDQISSFTGPAEVVMYRDIWSNLSSIAVVDPDKGLEKSQFTMSGPSTLFRLSDKTPANIVALMENIPSCITNTNVGCVDSTKFTSFNAYFDSIIPYIEIQSRVDALGESAKLTVVSNLDSNDPSKFGAKTSFPLVVKLIEKKGSTVGDTVETVLYSVAGAFCFLGLISMYVAWRGLHTTKKKKRRSSSSDDSDDDDIEVGKPTKKKKGSKKGKGKGDEDPGPRTLTPSTIDDSIFDWEKHIDKKTGDVYYFNPKTGQSQWDPPKARVKK